MAASPPPLYDPTPNRDVVAVHRHLVNQFEPATKQLADAGVNLYRALNGATLAAKEYSRALQGIVMTSQQGQQTSKELGLELSHLVPVVDKINGQHEETNSDTLARFYQENQMRALAQERKRYQFVVEKHRDWLASYGEMFQVLAPIVKEATRLKVVETPEEAADNQAAPPTAFTPPDVDSTISLSRSTSQSSTEAPPYTNDEQEHNTNIAFVSMTKRDSVTDHQSTPVKTPVEVPHRHERRNGSHDDDQENYSQVVKHNKQRAEQPVLGNAMPGPQDIIMMKPETSPKPTPAPPPPPPPVAGNERILYVVHDFVATSDSQMSIYTNDRIRLQKSGTQGWAFGINLTTKQSGWFPQGFAQEAFTVQ